MFTIQSERIIWLSGKVVRNNIITNKNDVVSEAGQIWSLLSERKILSVKRIGEMTHYHESLVCLALGWLVKENKVRLFEKSGVLHAELNISIPEMYY